MAEACFQIGSLCLLLIQLIWMRRTAVLAWSLVHNQRSCVCMCCGRGAVTNKAKLSPPESQEKLQVMNSSRQTPHISD